MKEFNAFAQEVHYQAEEKRPLGYDKSLEDAKEIISILSYPVIIPNGKGPTQDILKWGRVEEFPSLFLSPPPPRRRSQAPTRTLLGVQEEYSYEVGGGGGSSEGAILVQTTTCAWWRPPPPQEGVLRKVRSSSEDSLPNPEPTLITHPTPLSPMRELRPPPGWGKPLKGPTAPDPGLLPHPTISKARRPLLCLTAVLPPPGSPSSPPPQAQVLQTSILGSLAPQARGI